MSVSYPSGEGYGGGGVGTRGSVRVVAGCRDRPSEPAPFAPAGRDGHAMIGQRGNVHVHVMPRWPILTNAGSLPLGHRQANCPRAASGTLQAQDPCYGDAYSSLKVIQLWTSSSLL